MNALHSNRLAHHCQGNSSDTLNHGVSDRQSFHGVSIVGVVDTGTNHTATTRHRVSIEALVTRRSRRQRLEVCYHEGVEFFDGGELRGAVRIDVHVHSPEYVCEFSRWITCFLIET